MKKILITVSEMSAIRNVLRTRFWETVRAREDVRVALVVAQDLYETCRSEFAGERVEIHLFAGASVGKLEKIIAFLARNGFVSGTHRIMQHRAQEIGETRIPLIFKTMLAHMLGNVRPLRALVRALDNRITSHASVIRIFDECKPDLVFSTVVLDPVVDVPILREARRRNVRTVAMVRSWDNLTTYGLIRILPDTFLAQCEFLRERVIALHDMPSQSVVVVGTPQFDMYARQDLLETREAYCARIGISQDAVIILYAAIGDFLFPTEGVVADVFESLASAGKLPPKTMVIFRAHPAFESPLERMKDMCYVIPDRQVSYTSSNKTSWDMKDMHTAHLLNSIRHASVVVTTSSTMLIEAALMDTPVVNIAFDPAPPRSYWFSAVRWSDTAVHIVDLLRCRGVLLARSAEDLAGHIRTYVEDPLRDQAGRKSVVKRFVGPNHGEAAVAVANAILSGLTQVGKGPQVR